MLIAVHLCHSARFRLDCFFKRGQICIVVECCLLFLFSAETYCG